MKNCCVIIVFLLFALSGKAASNLDGKWRGVIIGHVDNRNYFINGEMLNKKKDGVYALKMHLFSDDYSGEFVLQLLLKEDNKLYIQKVEKLKEFPYPYLRIEDCFSGYFQLKTDANNKLQLDLYRNPVYHKIDEFTNIDGDGNFVSGFECFTSVTLKSSISDTTYSALEKQYKTMMSAKVSRTDEAAKRKIVTGKNCIVKNGNIILQVWDNNKEDGDIISLKLNNTWVLTNFLLKKEKYTLKLKLNRIENQLMLFAENLGSIPPNTAAISIDDATSVKTFILNSDMKKSEVVNITLAEPSVTKPK